jgi:hypothetical protein
MNFPTQVWASLPKKPGGKSKRILYQSFLKVIFSAFLTKYGRKPKQLATLIVHLCAIFAAVNGSA